MEIDINTVVTIALGVFIALVARDILSVVLGKLFGFGAITGGKQSATNTVSKTGGHQLARES